MNHSTSMLNKTRTVRFKMNSFITEEISLNRLDIFFWKLEVNKPINFL